MMNTYWIKHKSKINKIKLLCLLFLNILLFAYCSKDKSNIDVSVIENQAAIKFENDVLNFHTIRSGEKVTGSFKFKNVGDNDLVIGDVSANCGCTVADYPKKAIKPGEEGMISVTYDSKGTSGIRIEKLVTVSSNTNPSRTVLKVIADVE
ncbi:MAG: DUF1573 domain-containing protein [Bacteroidota bacterium]|nr:DUF1573 domain-containing protein [Bacteroidota bacterium]